MLERLPESTGAWTCRWFLLIFYVSVWLVALGLTVVPGAAGIVATCLGCFSLGLALGSRRSNETCAAK